MVWKPGRRDGVDFWLATGPDKDLAQGTAKFFEIPGPDQDSAPEGDCQGLKGQR